MFMQSVPYIFNQITQWLPRDHFEWLVKKFKGNAYVKGYTCWNHLLTMIWAQLTARRSLRDIETSLRAHSDKTYRMGIGKSVSRNNIAHANASREVGIFRELAQEMMKRASAISIRDEVLKDIGIAFSVSGFLAIDSTTISLELSRYSWSIPQQGYGGVKVHTLFDLLRKTPRMCLVTGHEERDQTFMADYPFESQCLYVMDKAYCKTQGLWKINDSRAYFLVRIKQNMVYEVLQAMTVTGTRVLADEVIRFTSRWAAKGYPATLRMITYYSPEKNQTFSCITTHMNIDAASSGLLYLYRWEIELFFKWIKQHLRITNFYGYSENAVIIQIYTAYIAYCLLALAADNAKFDGSLYEFSNLVSTCLTEKVWLDKLIERHKGSLNVGMSPEHPSLFHNI